MFEQEESVLVETSQSQTKTSIGRVLITGGAGLIGSAVIRRLVAEPLEVIAIDNFSIGGWRESSDNLVWEEIDITSPLFEEAIGNYSPDIVVHCAAHPGGKSLLEPVVDVHVNALGSMRIFEFCARREIPVIYLSSSVIYGDQPRGPIPESAPLNPGTIYGACKVACENFLQTLEEGYGLQWTVLRLFATYGPGHKPSAHQGIVNVMLTQLLSGDRVIVRGSLERERDLLYVEDAASAIIKSIFTPRARGEIINVGTGVPVTIRSLIETLCRMLGKRKEKIEIIEDSGTVGDPFYNSADCSRARKMIGFVPRYDLNKGLSELLRLRLGMQMEPFKAPESGSLWKSSCAES